MNETEPVLRGADNPGMSRARPIRRGQKNRAVSVDVLRVALFLFIIISISTVQGYIRVLALLRPGVTLWIVALGAVILLPRSVNWTNLWSTWPPKAVAGIVALALLGAPFGLSLGASGAFFLDSYSRVLLLFFLLVVAIRTARDLHIFLWAYALAAGILALLSMTVMQMVSSFGGNRVEASSLYDANDLGVIFVSAIPICLILSEVAGRRGRLLVALTLILIAAATAITGSRGAFIGLLVVLPGLLVAASHVPVRRRAGLAVVLVFGLAVGAPEGYWERIGTIFNISEDYNYDSAYGRVEVAKRGVGYMLRSPVVGVGLANFPRAEVTISPLLRSGTGLEAIRNIAPHNTYVQVGAELGLPALLLWISVLMTGIVGLHRKRRMLRRLNRDLGGTFETRLLERCGTYLPLTFLGFACTSYFVSHAYTPVFYILVALLTGVLALHRSSARALAATVRRAAPLPDGGS